MAARVRGYVQARPERCTCDEPAKGNDVSGPCQYPHGIGPHDSPQVVAFLLGITVELALERYSFKQCCPTCPPAFQGPS